MFAFETNHFTAATLVKFFLEISKVENHHHPAKDRRVQKHALAESLSHSENIANLSREGIGDTNTAPSTQTSLDINA